MATELATPKVFTQEAPAVPAPPVARKIPKVDIIHGEQRVDNYFWLREKSSPEVLAYLEAETAYADAVTKPTEGFQKSLFREMLSHLKETDLSVPYQQGNFLYYSRTEKGKQYPTWCRKKGSPEVPEEIILDLNELAKGQEFLGLGAFEVSDDGNLLAYSTDVTGFREYTLFVKDLRTGELLPERIEKVDSVAWAGDNATIFYTTEDAAKRPYRLFRHRLKSSGDQLVFEERDERFRVDISRARSKACLFLTSASLTTSEVHYLPTDRAGRNEDWKLISPREPDREYDVEHCGDLFYIRTNDRGRNFRLVAAPVSDPRKENWKEILPHRLDVMLEGTMFFANHYVLFEREAGLPHLRITNLGTGESHRIEFPEPAYSVSAGENHESETTTFRYRYQSLITPNSVFDYDMEKQQAKLLKQTEVPGGYHPERYQSERLHATAADGTRIPVSLVYRKEMQCDGTRPLLLTGYGAYGYPLPDGFSSSRLCLLDRGAIFAIAHVRGGGEMGKAWHDQGRMLNKKNTFTDFIAAAEYLVDQKYTSKDQLIIDGGSAGGLLIGAALNMRPDLFRAAILGVPFVDVINTMLDPSVPLTVTEFEEWGNPAKKQECDYIKTYCPYTNLAERAYPAILVRTSLNDSQVMYWEPVKYVAKLRALKTDSHPLLLKINMAAGHGGASGRYDHLRELAIDYAFILRELGITE